MEDRSESTGIQVSNMVDNLEEAKVEARSEMKSNTTSQIRTGPYKDLSKVSCV